MGGSVSYSTGSVGGRYKKGTKAYVRISDTHFHNSLRFIGVFTAVSTLVIQLSLETMQSLQAGFLLYSAVTLFVLIFFNCIHYHTLASSHYYTCIEAHLVVLTRGVTYLKGMFTCGVFQPIILKENSRNYFDLFMK